MEKNKPSQVTYLHQISEAKKTILRERATLRRENKLSKASKPKQIEIDADLSGYPAHIQRIAMETRAELQDKMLSVDSFCSGELHWLDLEYQDMLARYIDSVDNGYIIQDVAAEQDIFLPAVDEYGVDTLPYLLDRVYPEDAEALAIPAPASAEAILREKLDEDLKDFPKPLQRMVMGMREDFKNKTLLLRRFYEGDPVWLNLDHIDDALVVYLRRVENSELDEHILLDLRSGLEIRVPFEDQLGRCTILSRIEEVDEKD